MKKLTAIMALFALASCAGVSESHRLADEAIYEAIEPDYRKYVEADESLPQSLKNIKLRTLERWREMLDEFAKEQGK